ncbi:DUF805 domain-containing protein [Leucobacter aridicollis]|uniref:DUF805 domain-containing protein n=1 Tax=Leucobacter aridicollis TaxID=283878 RepID=UPI0021075908|nr:DUF805 domain-containing protein [Leucobacter aridicollis]UTX53636.1 DUF805 domain-containing protein [Leucobacter aridicollis]
MAETPGTPEHHGSEVGPTRPRYASPVQPVQPVQPQEQPTQRFSYAPPQAPPYAPPPAMPPGFAIPGPGEPFDGAASPDDLARPLYGASFAQAIVRFFKNYASFSGRASRSEYWWVMLACFGLWFVAGTLANIIETASYAISGASYQAAAVVNGMLGLVLAVAGLGLIVPTLAVTWRRLHDANLPGPLFFVILVPGFGWIAHIVLLALPPRVEGRRFYRAF